MTTGEFTEHLKTTFYLLDVLRQLGPNGVSDRPTVSRFMLRYVIRSSDDVMTFVLRSYLVSG